MNVYMGQSFLPNAPNGTCNEPFDLCIVGAGPAGIAIAREFIGSATRVCLVESGGNAIADATQDLAKGETFGDSFNAPDVVCVRAFGGNSNVWHVRLDGNRAGLRLVPLNEMDFGEQDWLPFSGWPFAASHLAPHFERAQQVCQSGPFAYAPADWETAATRRLPLADGTLETAMFQFGPADIFHTQYRQELASAPNISILLNGTALELETNPETNAVTRLHCARADGERVAVTARQFVLATGGFQNARLLLMSNKQAANGIGNQHDVVGRYLHDHPIVFGGLLTPFDTRIMNRMAFYDLRQVDGFPAMGHFRLSEAARRQHGLLAISALLFPRPMAGRTRGSVLALRELWREVRGGGDPKRLATLARVAARRVGKAAMAMALPWRAEPLVTSFGMGGWSQLPGVERLYDTFQVFHQAEQTPDPANRVALGQERDRLGSPSLEVHWRWSQDDMDQVARAQVLMAAEFRRSGIGEFQIARKDGRPDIVRPSGSSHLMGTTRMHRDPKLGVVDADCRVHGVANLFVAGSSVFPTGGYANPTLTSVALALRLADHLKRDLVRVAAEGATAEGATVGGLRTGVGVAGLSEREMRD